MSNKFDLHSKLFEAFKLAQPLKSAKQNQDDCNSFWNLHKDRQLEDAQFTSEINEKIQELKNAAKQPKGTLKAFFKPLAQAESSTSAQIIQGSNISDKKQNIQAQVVQNEQSSVIDAEKSSVAPKQEEISKRIHLLKSELYTLTLREESGVLTESQAVDMKKKKVELIECEKKLKALKSNAERVKNHRQQQKRKLEQLVAENPHLASSPMLAKKGRPSMVETHPDLLSTIVEIATFGAPANDKRRNEILRSIKTLDELREELKNRGFDLGRSTLYYHLQARNPNSKDGRRHIDTVPVKLKKPENNIHRDHEDGKFCAATIKNLLQLASFLGPNEVSIISQDDKAKVPMGVTAAKTQSPLLMHMEYQVRLPDHDFAIAQRHKLTPSVYAALEIQPNGFGDENAVKYSGPTYIAIRSMKHASSTAYSHLVDLKRLNDVEIFDKFMKTPCGSSKPVMIQLVDGGPDENPRYQKTIAAAIHNFVTYNLDALFIATNAPGRSAFNHVERRMAPLSKELAGVILPYETFGSHLKNGKTVDTELEKKNFEYAGTVLGEIFSNVVIDNFPTVAEYIKPEESEMNVSEMVQRDEEWKSIHVRSSQYFLQIVKCNDSQCCKTEGNYLKLFPHRFMPALIPLSYDQGFLEFKSSNNNKTQFSSLSQSIIWSSTSLPYDQHLSSVQNQIQSRICKDCGIYVASAELLKQHQQNIHQKPRKFTKVRPKKIISKRQNEILIISNEESEEAQWVNEDEVETDNMNLPEILNVEIPIITVEKQMCNPWEKME